MEFLSKEFDVNEKSQWKLCFSQIPQDCNFFWTQIVLYELWQRSSTLLTGLFIYFFLFRVKTSHILSFKYFNWSAASFKCVLRTFLLLWMNCSDTHTHIHARLFVLMLTLNMVNKCTLLFSGLESCLKWILCSPSNPWICCVTTMTADVAETVKIFNCWMQRVGFQPLSFSKCWKTKSWSWNIHF